MVRIIRSQKPKNSTNSDSNVIIKPAKKVHFKDYHPPNYSADQRSLDTEGLI